jgi:hypothetical protein
MSIVDLLQASLEYELTVVSESFPYCSNATHMHDKACMQA